MDHQWAILPCSLVRHCAWGDLRWDHHAVDCGQVLSFLCFSLLALQERSVADSFVFLGPRLSGRDSSGTAGVLLLRTSGNCS